MLVSAYDFQLNHPCPLGLTTIAKFDGKHPAMACATTGGKVLIHTPYANQQAPGPATSIIQQNKGKDIKFLNTNKEIIAMSSGALDPSKDNEMLFIGSKTNLIAYNVEDNSDLFDKEVSDGVNCLTFGTFPNIGAPMVVAGGNCSITGFDLRSEERFWTVTGDNVTALEFLDWNEDGEDELIAGSEDFSIRVFKDEELIFDINEQSKISFLKRIHKQVFAYALSNGTFGVYHNRKRLWKQKAKDRVTAMIGVDFDLDGQYEVVTGFASGLIEARKHRTGEIIHKSNMNTTVSKLFYYDYRMDGLPQVIVVDTEGDVKGLSLTRNVKQFSVEDEADVVHKATQDAFVDLNKQKIELMNKLEKAKEKKDNVKKKATNPDAILSPQAQAPTKAEIFISSVADPNSGTTILQISLNKQSWIIKSVIIFNESLFEGESFVHYPNQSTSQVQIPLKCEKNQELTLDIRVLMGAGLNSQQFLIHHEPRYKLPKFSMFKHIPEDQKFLAKKPESQVMFVLENKKVEDFVNWLQTGFVLEKDRAGKLSILANYQQSQVRFIDARSTGPLILNAQLSGAGLQVTIMSDSIEVCGDIVQDFASAYLKITELDSEASFPFEMKKLQDILARVQESNNLKSHFSANISENINNLKVFIVKAEASLMIGDIDSMKKCYATVQQENGSLVGEYLKRSNNHQELITTLKELNNMIRNGSNLRLGNAQKKVMTECRECIRSNTTNRIPMIIQKGV